MRIVTISTAACLVAGLGMPGCAAELEDGSTDPGADLGVQYAAGPTVSAGSPVTMTLPIDRVTFHATATPPAGGSITNIQWTERSGPTTAIIRNAKTLTATPVALKQGTYVFRITVTDNAGLKATSDITVTVNAAAPMPTTVLGQIAWLPAPVFKTNHTLPPLVKDTLYTDITFERPMVEKFGYAFDLHDGTSYWAGLINTPGSDVYQKIALNHSNPKKYPLFIAVDRPFYHQSVMNTWIAQFPSVLTSVGDWSPAAPTAAYTDIGQKTAQYISSFQAAAPLAVVLNWGEYGIGTGGGSGGTWANDPAVVAAKNASGLDWNSYASASRARLEGQITQAVEAAAPTALYFFFRTDASIQHSRYGWWDDWAYDYDQIQGLSSLPNSQLYYNGDEIPHPVWDNPDNAAGYSGSDMMTCALATVAWQIQEGGDPLSYNWLSSGWTQAGLGGSAYASYDRYLGFLKSFYMAGQIGGIAFAKDAPDVTSNVGQALPHWVEAMVALGETHALYSHLEDYLRNGSLLPGAFTHKWSTAVPAYEFTNDRQTRVIARKHNTKQQWIISAWAEVGNDRNVTVTIPTLGTVTLAARIAGSVYSATIVNGAPALELIDTDALHPTDTLMPNKTY